MAEFIFNQCFHVHTSLAAELNVFFQKDTVRKHQKQGKQQHAPPKIPEVIEAGFGDLGGSEERVGRQKTDSPVTDDVGEAGNAILNEHNQTGSQQRTAVAGKQNSHHQPHCSEEQRHKGQGQGNQEKLSPRSSGTECCHGEKGSQQIRRTHDRHADKHRPCLCPINCFPGKGLCKQVFRGSFRTFSGVNGNAEVHPENAGGNHEKAGQEPVNTQRRGQVFHRYADAPVKVRGAHGFKEFHGGRIQKAVISRCHEKDARSQGDGPAQDIGSMPSQFIFQNDHA